MSLFFVGTLLKTIEKRGHLTEQEASLVIRDIARAVDFLHKKGNRKNILSLIFYSFNFFF